MERDPLRWERSRSTKRPESAKIEDEDLLRRREIYEMAKTFEERVAELFGLLGYRTIVDYKRDDIQFDVRLEMASGALPSWALVECKDTGETVTQKQVRDLRPRPHPNTFIPGFVGAGNVPAAPLGRPEAPGTCSVALGTTSGLRRAVAALGRAARATGDGTPV